MVNGHSFILIRQMATLVTRALAEVCTVPVLLVYWATVCKTVCPMLSDRCPVCPVLSNVGVLWPNGWMDQDETWHARRTRPWPRCIRRGPSSPSPKGAQPPSNFRPTSTSVMAKWLDG